MGIFGGDSKNENDDFSNDPEITSAYASYEAALREVLEKAPENIVDPSRGSKGGGDKGRWFANIRKIWPYAVPIVGMLLILALAWAIGFGPLAPVVRQMVAQMNERAIAPIATETTAPTETSASALPTTTVAPTAIRTSPPTSTSTLAVTPTPKATETAAPTQTPTSAETGCVPAESISLEDVGQELCVTARVFSAEVFETYFSVRTGEDFYFVSYAKGWYAGYGTTWELKKGECVYATGKIERIGSFPLMQVGYKNPLERCQQP